jgi:hypothetical protein
MSSQAPIRYSPATDGCSSINRLACVDVEPVSRSVGAGIDEWSAPVPWETMALNTNTIFLSTCHFPTPPPCKCRGHLHFRDYPDLLTWNRRTPCIVGALRRPSLNIHWSDLIEVFVGSTRLHRDNGNMLHFVQHLDGRISRSRGHDAAIRAVTHPAVRTQSERLKLSLRSYELQFQRIVELEHIALNVSDVVVSDRSRIWVYRDYSVNIVRWLWL